MYLNYRSLEGYNLPVMIILAPRGIGKTFGIVYRCINKFIEKGQKFIYIVETIDMVKTLSQNKGSKFFERIIDFNTQNLSIKNRRMLDFLEINTEISEYKETKNNKNTIIGGTITIGGKTAGYIMSFNDYANVKRNNFSNTYAIIIDEFIPEKMDIRTTKNPYKMVNIVQSIARTDKLKIYMLANSIRMDDPVLVRMKLHTLKVGEIRVLYVKGKRFAVAWNVDPADYPEYMESLKESVAGQFAELMQETDLDNNTYSNELPNNLKIPQLRERSKYSYTLTGKMGTVVFNITPSGSYYVYMSDSLRETKNWCLDYQYTKPNVRHVKIRDGLLIMYQINKILFQDTVTYNIFKDILNVKI